MMDIYREVEMGRVLDVIDNVPSFRTMWKNEFQHYPQVPIDWKKEEPYKEFAEKIYDAIVKEVNNGIEEL